MKHTLPYRIHVVVVTCLVPAVLASFLRRNDGDSQDVEGVLPAVRCDDRDEEGDLLLWHQRVLQQVVDNSSTSCTEACCQTNFACPVCPTTACSTSSSPFSSLPDAFKIILIAILISVSAMFSGLTLGLMGLDKTGLEIVMHSDDAKNAAYARTIYPVRKNGNLLLSTLLLGNTSCNALLSILMADYAGGTVGFLTSTFLILVFGEIIPQAACQRYALRVGSMAVPLVRIIQAILYPITKPLAFALDYALGDELATTYSGREMLKLLQIHVEENVIDKDTANTMTGALQYTKMAVRDVMTPLKNVFMLRTDEKLNFETIAKIFKTGYSRIPVYEVSKNNVVGLLFVKDLIFIDPEDESRVSDFVEIFGRGVHVVWPTDRLGDVLRELKQGRSHMALVRDVNNEDATQDPFYEIVGIITLEDIIEEILGDEIVDETDAFLDGTHSVKLNREDAFKFARLRLLDSKIVDESLSFDETRAIVAHLCKNYADVVSLLTETQLQRLIAETPVSILPTAEQRLGEDLPSDLLYKNGEPSDICTLILAGKVTVIVGSEKFRSDVSSWCLLGAKALEESNFKPDFSAFVSGGPCRCIRISRARFAAAVDASTTERQATQHSLIGSLNNVAEQSEGTDIGILERSRQTKLVTALRAVEQKQKDADATEKLSSSIVFAEAGDVTKVHSELSPPPKSSQSTSIQAAIEDESKASKFEFIVSPAAKDRLGDDDNAAT